jgi:hypothetical protein
MFMRMLVQWTAAATLAVSTLAACSGTTTTTFEVRPVDEAVRSAALEAIARKADEIGINGKDRATQNQAIAEHVRTFPDIAFASVSADGVVAVFFDGQPIILLNNIYRSEIKSSSSPLRQPEGGREPFDVPSGKRARLMNGFTADFPPDSNPEIGAMLGKKGYDPVATGASVEDFRAVGGDAVLHIRTHGGAGDVLDKDGNPVQGLDDSNKPAVDKDGKPVPMRLFALWTTDAVTTEKYKAEIVSRRLVRMYDVVSPGVFLNTKQWHLGISGLFVHDNWGSLAKNAYVHVSACAGGLRAEFVETIMNKGTNVFYVGWDNPAKVSDMDRAAKYVFDRMTGANLLDTADDPKEDPPQRPFDFDSIAALMQQRGLSSSAGAKMTARHDGDMSAFILAPSIASVESYDYADESLLLRGRFGTDQYNATITVGGDECSITRWTSKEVLCKLGRTSKGEVVVKVGDHESNRVKLSSWRGTLTYAIESSPPGLSQVWTLKLHLRGDVGDYRDKPGEKPVAHQKVISMSKDSTADVVASGTAASSKCTITWTAKTFQVPPWGPPVIGPGYFLNADGVVDKDDPGHLWFEVGGYAEPCYDRSSSGNDCSVLKSSGHCGLPTSTELLAPKAVHPYGDLLSGRLSKPAVLTPDGTIQAGDIQPAPSICCGGEFNQPWSYTQRAQWDAMTPEANTAPDPKRDER